MKILASVILVFVACVGASAQKRKVVVRKKPPVVTKQKTETDKFWDELAQDYIDRTNRNKDKWFYIGKSDLTDYYFNPSKTAKHDLLIDFWVRENPIKLDEYWKHHYDTLGIDLKRTDFSGFDFCLYHYQANCVERTLGTMQIVEYMKDGKTGGGDFTKVGVSMGSVVPDSVGELWFKSACAVK